MKRLVIILLFVFSMQAVSQEDFILSEKRDEVEGSLQLLTGFIKVNEDTRITFGTFKNASMEIYTCHLMLAEDICCSEKSKVVILFTDKSREILYTHENNECKKIVVIGFGIGSSNKIKQLKNIAKKKIKVVRIYEDNGQYKDIEFDKSMMPDVSKSIDIVIKSRRPE